MTYTYCRETGGQVREVLSVARHTEDNNWLVIHRDWFKANTTSLATPLEIFQSCYRPIQYDFNQNKWVRSDRKFPFPEDTELRDEEKEDA